MTTALLRARRSRGRWPAATPRQAPTFATLLERRLPFPSRWRTWRLIARWIRLINPHMVDMDLDRHGTTLLEVARDVIVLTGLSPDGAATHRWTVTRDGLA